MPDRLEGQIITLNSFYLLLSYDLIVHKKTPNKSYASRHKRLNSLVKTEEISKLLLKFFYF